MATGYSRVADLNSLYNDIYEDAVFVAKETSLATRIVRTYTNGKGDQTRTLSEYPETTPQQVDEAEDFSNPTRFDKTALATLTPYEYMSQAILTDRRAMTDPQNARNDIANGLGREMAEYIDKQILNNFSSLTGGTLGASGTSMVWGYLFAAQSILRANKVPRPYYAVLHPYQWHDIAEDVSVAGSSAVNAPEFQDQVMREWYVSNVGGMDGIFVSANVPTSGTDAYGAVFNPWAIAFDLRKDLTLEPERDASRRATELNLSVMFATGVWRAAYGCQIITDITTPTS